MRYDATGPPKTLYELLATSSLESAQRGETIYTFTKETIDRDTESLEGDEINLVGFDVVRSVGSPRA